MGSVTQLMAEHNVSIRQGRKEIHRDQALVERFNRTLAERLFGYQYAKELENPHKRNREWVKRLPEVIKAINSETKKPPPVKQNQPAGKPICPDSAVRYLYQPGEQEGGWRRRATARYGVSVFIR